MKPAARGALDDLVALKFRHRSEDSQRELVFRIGDIILAADDDLLSVFYDLRDDDVLVRHLAGDAVRAQEVDRVKGVRLQIPSQLL